MRMKFGRRASAAQSADGATNSTASAAKRTRHCARFMGWFLQESLQLCETPLEARLQSRVAFLIRVPISCDLHEQLHHVPKVGEVDVFRGDFALGGVHVVVVAQRDADAGGGET